MTALAAFPATLMHPPMSAADASWDRNLVDGLVQRAAILEALLDDLLGRRALLTDDVLPRAFLRSHPGWALACSVRTPVPSLAAITTELLRCPDGQWRVASDQAYGQPYGQAHPLASLLSAPALAAFLPGLSRRLLGQSLRLASLPALWLGDPGATWTASMDERRWAIRDAHDAAIRPTPLAALTTQQRIRLQNQVEAEPWRFVATMVVRPSSAPVRNTLVRDGTTWQPGRAPASFQAGTASRLALAGFGDLGK